MKKLYFLLSLLLYINYSLLAQGITQTIRGTVIDKESNKVLEGVTVAVRKDSAILSGTATDESGSFRLEKIPVGRVDVVVSFVGYKKVQIPNLLLSSGKESVLNIEMESSIETMKDVVISGSRKGETINEMAVLSARAFSVEESSSAPTSDNAQPNDPPRHICMPPGADAASLPRPTADSGAAAPPVTAAVRQRLAPLSPQTPPVPPPTRRLPRCRRPPWDTPSGQPPSTGGSPSGRVPDSATRPPLGVPLRPSAVACWWSAACWPPCRSWGWCCCCRSC